MKLSEARHSFRFSKDDHESFVEDLEDDDALPLPCCGYHRQRLVYHSQVLQSPLDPFPYH